jgi:DsbC/DsbD-like thiol-disulfide interchange protein
MRLLLIALFAVATLVVSRRRAVIAPLWRPRARTSMPNWSRGRRGRAGQPLTVGLKLKHQKDWHTYWLVPGDSGLPTRIEWATAGRLRGRPDRVAAPEAHADRPADELRLRRRDAAAHDHPGARRTCPTGSTVTLSGKAEWLECKDVCIPGEADIALTLPVRPRGAVEVGGAFHATRAKVPQPARDIAARGTIEDNRIRVALSLPAGKTLDRVEFFPLQEGEIEPAAEQVLVREGDVAALYLTTAAPAPTDFSQLAGVLVANGGPAAGGWTASSKRRSWPER